MTAKSVFITATGTDVGKTYISSLIVKKMLEFGYNCGYYKPVLSGAILQKEGSLLPGDCDFVVKMSGLKVKPSDCVSYCFEEAVSPHLAAERSGASIDREYIKQEFNLRENQYDYLVVEGAGGITCPFNLKESRLLISDVIKFLGMGILIVADAGLGTINSVLLTVEYAKSHNLRIEGIVLNNFDKNNFMHIDNKEQITKLTGIDVIATVDKGARNLDITQENLLKIFK